MSAAAPLRDRGFLVELAKTGGVVVRPAKQLTDDLRRYVRTHLTEIKRELKEAANDPRRTQSVQAWTVHFTNGRGCTAVNVTGADRSAMVEECRERFGRDAVDSVEAQA